MDRVLSRLRELFLRTHGFDLSEYDDAFVRDTLARRLAELGLPEADAYGSFLAGSDIEAAAFVDALRISYTRFFRDPLAFALLESRILPALLAQKAEGSEIRIWSAGCASGQEAYSIAMTIEDVLANCGRSLNYRIFATDARPGGIEAAKTGLYSPDDVKELKLRHLEKHFRKVPGGYQVVPGLKSHIEFSVHDFLDPEMPNPPGSIFGDFDIVFCSNILYYYQERIRVHLLAGLSRSLAASGVLVTDDASQSILDKRSEFQPFESSIAVFRKRALASSIQREGRYG